MIAGAEDFRASVKSAIESGLIERQDPKDPFIHRGQTHKRTRRPIPKPQSLRIIALAKRGFRQSDIAAIMERHPASISNVLRGHGEWVYLTHAEMDKAKEAGLVHHEYK